jgi:hypothetical protein
MLREFYTSPFIAIPKSVPLESRNVLIAYTNKEHCIDTRMEVLKKERYTRMQSTTLEELKYMAQILGMPLVVILNLYCDMQDKSMQCEIYYHESKFRYGLKNTPNKKNK